MDVRNSFGQALRLVRQSQGLSQEDFSIVSSRTYVSLIERGGTSPTLEKLDSLCRALDVHPVTMIALTYLLGTGSLEDYETLLSRVSNELMKLVAEQTTSAR
ncbi:DNA-binding protein [Pseudomonas asuensis]|jgi:transcriptional regulator with XRE-family HTH domain|uniref:DNA-binding protein n=2 Tax=Pseudomonas asuensis TaxID=1825787 RepID=A0ABQ2H429_9PSED|nr:DNA-binding protein [Pseudomonas asuensis]